MVCATPVAADLQDRQFFPALGRLGLVMTDPTGRVYDSVHYEGGNAVGVIC